MNVASFDSPSDYMPQIIPSTLASNEADTFLLDDGAIVGGWDPYADIDDPDPQSD
jgi:hypothetical protein